MLQKQSRLKCHLVAVLQFLIESQSLLHLPPVWTHSLSYITWHFEGSVEETCKLEGIFKKPSILGTLIAISVWTRGQNIRRCICADKARVMSAEYMNTARQSRNFSLNLHACSLLQSPDNHAPVKSILFTLRTCRRVEQEVSAERLQIADSPYGRSHTMSTQTLVYLLNTLACPNFP